MVARLAAILTVVAALALAPSAMAVVVSPGSLDGWQITTSAGTGSPPPSAVFETGPASPPGPIGSLQLSPGGDGSQNAAARNPNYDGVRLADITGLSYWGYVDEQGTGGQSVFVILNVDSDNDGSGDDQLFFEPVYQNGTFPGDPVPNQGTIALDTWQFWNARVGGWWALSDSTFGPPLKTLDTYVAANPNAVLRNGATGLGAVRFVVGFGAGAWDDFVGNIDSVVISTKTSSEEFNFEPDTDGDTVADIEDNCPAVANTDQTNTDGDAQGDACDSDDDGDGDADGGDNCPLVANPNQENNEGDAQGDVCDADDDNDGISDVAEAAVGTSPTDNDADDDGVNDSADACPRTPGTLPNGCPADTPEDAPPAVQFTGPAANSKVSAPAGTTLSANATDDKGVAQVAFVDADGVICTDTTAPYSCQYTPTGDDVGKNTIIAVASDAAGQTGTDSRRLNVGRFRTEAVSLAASPRRDASAPYRFTLSGTITLPDGVTARQGCRGTVVLRLTRGGKSAAATNAPVGRDCRYRRTLTVPAADIGALRATARFNGGAVLLPRSAKSLTLRAG